jgi:hypothetical protein
MRNVDIRADKGMRQHLSYDATVLEISAAVRLLFAHEAYSMTI